MSIINLDPKHLVEKAHILNEIRTNNMTLLELRFFSIYLSKINARKESTRKVRFKLREFEKIMELSRCKPKDIEPAIDRLLCKVVHVPVGKKGGYSAFQIFKECIVDQDHRGIWYVEIDAHDKALPLLFNFKSHYFTYQLWNALGLKSVNQLRMYEILKQYEYVGERTLYLEDLRGLLGIEPDEYKRWDNFRRRVLDACQKALEELTDIKFTYEPFKENYSRSINAIKFIIEKNESYKDPLALERFIDSLVEPDPELEAEEKAARYDEHLRFIAEACEYAFSNAEMQVIFNLLAPIKNQLKRYLFVKEQYDYMKMRNEKEHIQKPFGYFKKIVEAKIKSDYGYITFKPGGV